MTGNCLVRYPRPFCQPEVQTKGDQRAAKASELFFLLLLYLASLCLMPHVHDALVGAVLLKRLDGSHVASLSSPHQGCVAKLVGGWRQREDERKEREQGGEHKRRALLALGTRKGVPLGSRAPRP